MHVCVQHSSGYRLLCVQGSIVCKSSVRVTRCSPDVACEGVHVATSVFHTHILASQNDGTQMAHKLKTTDIHSYCESVRGPRVFSKAYCYAPKIGRSIIELHRFVDVIQGMRKWWC